MNAIITSRLYIKMMLKEVSGAKVILLDSFTRRLLSLVYTQTEVLQNDVLLIDMLEKRRRDKLPTMACVIFVCPNSNSLLQIKEELTKPKYDKYYIYFTNNVEEDVLSSIAENDKKQQVMSIKVVFTDYLAPDPNLFVLPTRTSVPLYVGQTDAEGKECCDRISRGIISAVLAMTKMKPSIRYNSYSQACEGIANRVQHLIDNEYNEFGQSLRSGDNSLVLLLDRRHDPITPLLTPWTYQAMVHESIGKGIRDNIIVVKRKKKKENDEDSEENEGEDEDKDDDLEREDNDEYEKVEFLFSGNYDEFNRRNKYHNWGDTCNNMKKQVERFKDEMHSNQSMETVEEMRKILENYGTLKKLNRQTNDHMTLVLELKKEIQTRSLMKLSKLEQEMVCSVGTGKHKEHYGLLMSLLNGKIRKDDALRLSLIYLLKYEGFEGARYSNQLKSMLSDLGFENEELEILNGILSFGGERVRRTTELFGESKGLKGILTRVRTALKDVENVFTQHTPLMKKLMEKVVKRNLPVSTYPFAEGEDHHRGREDMEFRKVFVFIVGGCTYSESLAIHELNRGMKSKRILFALGGTSILNSRKFIKEVETFQERIIGHRY